MNCFLLFSEIFHSFLLTSVSLQWGDWREGGREGGRDGMRHRRCAVLDTCPPKKAAVCRQRGRRQGQREGKGEGEGEGEKRSRWGCLANSGVAINA